ncbi:unnamed protein product [Musa acuminata subsp. malaccensis]|uniref:(wild Malaysian banana) hypothetical protein n=1 Tax=Musa acuminata subsp. malaccensis TaxID=214687 RepID=A0A804HLZ3_MUSAM|nr:PREDICTED: gibberellin-regulated protein 1-like [Musa acuminata subsp. malaccensis]CAG1857049.1 unnamed protein product [Musa acuminata subsp. malaccensis]
MAPRLLLIASLLLLLLLFSLRLGETRRVLESETTSEGRGGRSLLNYTTMGKCRASWTFNLCKRACGTCCERCNCVPPGTYGNYDTCPCYAQMTTRGGQRKCP